jgi:outer membrane protein OmpA-like peptidoglycan-associated protein
LGWRIHVYCARFEAPCSPISQEHEENFMRIFAICMFAAGFLGSAAESNAAPIKDHTAVSRYPDSIASRRDNDGFKAYNLVVGVNDKGKTDAEALKALNVEGNVTRFAYENPKTRSAHEIFTNYREGLEKGGYEILFACAEKECGQGFAASRWGRVTGLRYHSPAMRYLAAKSSKNGQDIYVAVLVAKLRHQVEIVEVTKMEKGLVTAKAIADGLMLDGRAVLDGILFDTDKATIKPESKPALDVIAQYLKDHKDLKVFIVGHTDGTGTFDHNMNLSRDRAASVVNALKKDYGVTVERVASYGVGPLSPQKTNQDEGGRTQNRRVEMVQR